MTFLAARKFLMNCDNLQTPQLVEMPVIQEKAWRAEVKEMWLPIFSIRDLSPPFAQRKLLRRIYVYIGHNIESYSYDKHIATYRYIFTKQNYLNKYLSLPHKFG
jgi:hypothetical protein